MGLVPLLAAAALAAGCPAAPVQYGVNPASARELAPWISTGRGAAGIVGLLYAPYGETLGDRRVREAPGAVLHVGRTYKLGWIPRRWRGTGEYLIVEGRRVDGATAFRGRYRRALSPQFFPSDLTIPTAGCWRLILRTGGLRWTLHVSAVEPPAEPRCDTTAVRTGPNPIEPTFRRWVLATPAASAITAGLSLAISGIDGAAIYAGGRAPDGSNTKVLWLTRGGMPLRIWWTRLDGQESFAQTLTAAGGTAGAYPSIPVVPAAGCWLLRLRVDGRGGVIVARALAP